MNEELYCKLLAVDFQAAIYYEQMCKEEEIAMRFTSDKLIDLVIWDHTPQGGSYWYEVAKKLGEMS